MRKIHFVILISTLFIFQSCFELIEQVQLKDDGSGNFQVTLNMSQSKTKLNSIIKMATINGHPVPTKSDVTARLKEIEGVLAKTQGITNIKTSLDLNEYICVVSFDFSSVAQLNKAVKNIKLKEKATGDMLDDNYSYDPAARIFERKNRFQLSSIYNSMSNADKEIFSGASYTSIFKFGSTIAAASNKDGKISASKKAIMLKENALDIITGKKSIEDKINITH